MSRSRVIRLVAFLILGAAIIAAVCWLAFSERGHEITSAHAKVGREFRAWVADHPYIAPASFIAIYITLIVLMLPVWWMQILAGYGFQLVLGVLWCQVAATIGSVIAMILARWLMADWFHQRIETRLTKLRELDEKLGHNGFLVVMAVRLMHFMPIGISSYAFGLTTITVADVIVGTALGGIPAVAMYVGGGAGFRPWHNWRFLVVVAAVNLVLLIPLVLRYLRPNWFRKYGIE